MQQFIKTLFDITLLRKGPESIPRSWILFLLAMALWVFSGLAGIALIDRFDESDFLFGMFNGAIGVLCYAGLVVVSGHPDRLLQTISAVVGCGALIWLAFIAEYVLFMPFLGEVPTGLIGTLILFWSVPVEGHIIARSIDRHWYIGILIAVAVFSLQLTVDRVVSSAS